MFYSHCKHRTPGEIQGEGPESLWPPFHHQVSTEPATCVYFKGSLFKVYYWFVTCAWKKLWNAHTFPEGTAVFLCFWNGEHISTALRNHFKQQVTRQPQKPKGEAWEVPCSLRIWSCLLVPLQRDQCGGGASLLRPDGKGQLRGLTSELQVSVSK